VKTLIFISSILIFTIPLFYSCSNDPVSNSNYANLDSLNILWTDEFGNILGGDTTDWCPNNFFPAYPNPVRHDGQLNIKFFLPSKDTVTLFLIKSYADTLFLIKDEVLMAGTYLISPSLINWGSGVKRIFLFLKHNNIFNNYCRNYGDIWIK
jgi:hypothetical protein